MPRRLRARCAALVGEEASSSSAITTRSAIFEGETSLPLYTRQANSSRSPQARPPRARTPSKASRVASSEDPLGEEPSSDDHSGNDASGEDVSIEDASGVVGRTRVVRDEGPRSGKPDVGAGRGSRASTDVGIEAGLEDDATERSTERPTLAPGARRRLIGSKEERRAALPGAGRFDFDSTTPRGRKFWVGPRPPRARQRGALAARCGSGAPS